MTVEDKQGEAQGNAVPTRPVPAPKEGETRLSLTDLEGIRALLDREEGLPSKKASVL